MPTFETLPRFTADLQHLTPTQRRRFRRIVQDAFVPTYAPDADASTPASVSRACAAHPVSTNSPATATVERHGPGPETVRGEQHIVWRRIGGHEILNVP
ncbi:hypothetical protein [Streptomyces roseolilacinus]|uniref:Uncharacterized protein n=1 Tax=Streptomyces roseolilacinus TaxID=66904 RepID=A0A918B625_9ACTN|nr:hypothetical protein [Streptomyces roseolilacinus]GGQ33717.1 hypothetical protein GCM10010249_60270 [Streptomyces roseolilacinus]